MASSFKEVRLLATVSVAESFSQKRSFCHALLVLPTVRGRVFAKRSSIFTVKNTIFIDTPGLGANALDDQVTLDSLHIADVAILVINALRPGGEQAFELAERLRITGKKMFCVVTNADRVSEAELWDAMEEARKLFGDVIENAPIAFSSKKVRQIMEALETTADENKEAFLKDLDHWGYTPFRQALLTDYLLGSGKAATQRVVATQIGILDLLEKLRHGVSGELGHAESKSKAIQEGLSEADRVINKIMVPQKPFLDEKIKDTVVLHVSEFIKDLNDAVDLFIDRRTDISAGSLWEGMKALVGKISEKQNTRNLKKLQHEFEDLFPETHHRYLATRLHDSIQSLLQIGWQEISSVIINPQDGAPFDTDSINRQMNGLMVGLTVSLTVTIGAFIALLFIPGGALVDAVTLIVGLFGGGTFLSKLDARINRIKREARMRIRTQSKKLVMELSEYFMKINQQVFDSIKARLREGHSEKEAEKSRLIDLVQSWKQAHETLRGFDALISDKSKGAAA
ncbi:hypothetical protein [Desulfatirhabdium butyrativorans]|uniref:hypothetical protein n=1 Tax=Desulfatirhabdium butyrativorans TaxID=340467 RepID=UPI0003FD8C98|nr:hypothetical protein [Desulfatirhabdium butyrativorans]